MRKYQQLCITPEPQSYESFRGYILRLSESNYFKTPAVLLKIAGVSDEDIRLAEHPVEVIASISNKSPGSLAKISYDDSASDGQLAGHPIKKYYLQLRHPKVCIQCINEIGFVKASWDLAHVFVCSSHKVWLQEYCQACNRRLRWFRRGIGKCSCKADITPASGEHLPAAVVDLHRVIAAVIERQQLTDAESVSGMPFNNLSQLSLQTLMGIIQSIGARVIKLKHPKDTLGIKDNPRQEIIEAAQVFANWPYSFHDFLNFDGAMAPANVLSVFQRHYSIYSSLFKMSYPDHEVAFLRKELINYSNNKGLVVDKRMFEKAGFKECDFKQQNLSTLSKNLGITPSTLKNRIKKKQIQVEQSVIGSRPFFQNANNIIEGYIENTSGSLLIRDAARKLDLPVSVISELRRTGIIKARYKTLKTSGWAIQDLEEFESKLMENLIEGQPENPENFVSLKSVMRRKSITGKASVLAAVFNKELIGYKISSKIEDILIPKNEISRFFLIDVKINNDLVDINSAAAFLGCDREALSKTIANGLIEASQGTNTRFVSKENLEAFNQSFIFSTVAASLFGMSSVRFRKLSKDHDLEYILDASGRPHIPLLLRKDEFKKLEFLGFLTL